MKKGVKNYFVILSEARNPLKAVQAKNFKRFLLSRRGGIVEMTKTVNS
jgi:hypothetical protein